MMIGHPLIILDETSSSNNYAIAQAMSGSAKHGAAFMAKNQTAGKGQRGNTWMTEANKNIALSVLLKMSETPTDNQFQLIATVSLATYDFIKKYTLDEVKIKWMNDVYWRDRKAAGILIENKFFGQNWQWAVAGIGVNVNQTNFDETIKKKAVSIKQITGKDFDCVELSKELCMFLDKRYNQFQEKKFDELLNEYNENLYKKNEVVQLKFNNEVYSCIIRNADVQGNLWIDGAPKPYFSFGEIEWM